jgi:phospholipase/carboxylesterase
MKNSLLILLTIFSLNAYAQESEIKKDSLAGFEYISMVKGANNGKLPLLIAFHYSGGNPTETLADYDQLKSPVRIIIPKGNYMKRNGFSYYPSAYYQKDSLTQYDLARRTLDSMAKFVAAIEEKHQSIAIVSGISQGGDLSFLLAKHYPDLCRASFPFAAVIHPNINRELQQKAIKKIPIFLFQGDADPILSVTITKKRVQEIGKKMNLQLFTYPGVGHEISSQMKIDYSKIMDSYLGR